VDSINRGLDLGRDGAEKQMNGKITLSYQESREFTKIFSDWLRIRSSFLSDSNSALKNVINDPHLAVRILQQLAADVDHSDLLIRMLRGEKPLDYEDWKEKYR
jgi:hypothetical protein